MSATTQHFHAYNARLKPVARKLRKRMTKAEACMWKFILKAGQMKGYQFNRQRPVLNYVADFMCKELWLIIEVDGITHQYPEAISNDITRQKTIEAAGFAVLRFQDSEVLNNQNGVFTAVENWIIDYEKLHPEVKPPGRYFPPTG